MNTPVPPSAAAPAADVEVPILIGLCRSCAAASFPAVATCQRCGGTEVGEERLAGTGHLWTWTIQRFAPPSPPYAGNTIGFEPYAVGYVEFADGTLIEGRLTTADPTELEVGLPMQPCTIEYAPGGRTYAFTPVPPHAV